MHVSFLIFNVSMWFRCDVKFGKFGGVWGSELKLSCALGSFPRVIIGWLMGTMRWISAIWRETYLFFSLGIRGFTTRKDPSPAKSVDEIHSLLNWKHVPLVTGKAITRVIWTIFLLDLFFNPVKAEFELRRGGLAPTRLVVWNLGIWVAEVGWKVPQRS